jgi:hypothetical protein
MRRVGASLSGDMPAFSRKLYKKYLAENVIGYKKCGEPKTRRQANRGADALQAPVHKKGHSKSGGPCRERKAKAPTIIYPRPGLTHCLRHCEWILTLDV